MSGGQQPFDFAGAHRAAGNATTAQKQAEDFYKTQARDYAKKEESYRVALAEEIVRQHNDGVAWTVAPDLARGDKRVARLRMERDVAEGMKEAALQALWRHVADRKDLGRFITWSMRVDLAVHRGEQEAEPETPDIIGGKRAA